MKRILSSLFALVLSIGMCLPQASLAYAAGAASSSSSSAATGASAASQSSSSSASVPAASVSSNDTSITGSAATASASSSSDTAATQQDSKASKIASIPAASNVDESQEGAAYKEGEVLVVFKDSADSDAAKSTLDAAATVKTGQSDEKKKVTEDTVVAKVADGATVSQAVNELSQDADVAIVQPNYRYTLMDGESATQTGESSDSTSLTAQSTSISDPFTKSTSYQYQWQLSKYDAITSGTADLGINAFGAWDYAKCNGSVGVAVIDTGCKVDHPDLSANIVGAYNAYSAVTNTGSTTDVTDNCGHGTHVCGIIGAVSNNGMGGSGVSYNAKIMPVKACDDSNKYSFYDEELIAAYKYIIQNASTYHIRVINMSLGGTYGNVEDPTTWKDEGLMKQIDAAYSAGILTVCAAGNDGSSNTAYPSDYSTCMSVINLCQGLDTVTMKNAATKNSTSNYNASSSSKIKNISAPGTDIWSTYKEYDSYAGGYYTLMSGTSMASPVVAGVAALVFAVNVNLTPDDCKSIIYGTARDCVYTSGKEVAGAGWDVYTGYGEVDANAAVLKALSINELSSENCTLGTTSYTFDGNAHEPSVVVKNASGKALTLGTDYTVTYSNNINAGTATATISAIVGSGYTGTVEKTFTINQASISSAVISVANQVYAGSAIVPDAAVTWNGASLVKDTDYTVSCTGNTNIGTATFTITGMGNFSASSSKSATFQIIQADISNAVIATVSDQVYTSVEVKPVLSVTFNGLLLKEGVDYVASYQNNVDVGQATATIMGVGNFKQTTSKSAYFNIVYVAVTGITGIPLTLSVGSTTFSGAVLPTTAYGQTISYSLVSAGTTGATLVGSTLTTILPGTVKVRATVADGLGLRLDYTYDFAIKVTSKSSGWQRVDDYYYYISNGLIASGWVVSSVSPDGASGPLQRYFLGSDGRLVTGRLIDPTTVEDAAAGYYSYATVSGAVAITRVAAPDGSVYLADNDGRLADPGWLVTGAYDGGTLQRFYVDGSTHAARTGLFEADGSWYYGTPGCV